MEFLRRTQRWRLDESLLTPETAVFSLERAMAKKDGAVDCDGSDGIAGAVYERGVMREIVTAG